MIIGERLREIREARKLSQPDLAKRTGLHRFYISRVENGHTVPLVTTLERWVRALGLEMYQFLYEGEQLSSRARPSREGRARWSRGAIFEHTHSESRADEPKG